MQTKILRYLFAVLLISSSPYLMSQDYDYDDEPPVDRPVREYDEPAYQAGRPTGYADEQVYDTERSDYDQPKTQRSYEQNLEPAYEDPYQEREYLDSYDHSAPPPTDDYQDSYDDYDDY